MSTPEQNLHPTADGDSTEINPYYVCNELMLPVKKGLALLNGLVLLLIIAVGVLAFYTVKSDGATKVLAERASNAAYFQVVAEEYGELLLVVANQLGDEANRAIKVKMTEINTTSRPLARGLYSTVIYKPIPGTNPADTGK